ncbi:Na(+)-translocating NADH-quinone reductase subunit C [Neisseriaceae bacterium TC5R-5]|nr:Na(+)-translocating NADH-quinone reductase subunit C [Neisseriaceae bacterium TC5R-5]
MADENAKKPESLGKTLLFVGLLCLVCSVIVTVSAVGLRQQQQEQRLVDVRRNLLEVVGLLRSMMLPYQINNVFRQYVEPRLLDVNTGKFVAGDALDFDVSTVPHTAEYSLELSPEQDTAGLQWRSNIVRIYLVRNEQNAIETIVLPIQGRGVWSMMYAFLALAADGNTIRAFRYYRQGETPGIGGEIQNPNWSRQFTGKQLFDPQGQPALRIIQSGAAPEDIHGVDGVSGATATSVGVQNSFDFWLGEQGFGPFLKRVRAGELNHGG